MSSYIVFPSFTSFVFYVLGAALCLLPIDGLQFQYFSLHFLVLVASRQSHSAITTEHVTLQKYLNLDVNLKYIFPPILSMFYYLITHYL